MSIFGWFGSQKPTLESITKGIEDIKTKLGKLETDVKTLQRNPVVEPVSSPDSVPSTDGVSQPNHVGGARRSKKGRRTMKNTRNKRTK